VWCPVSQAPDHTSLRVNRFPGVQKVKTKIPTDIPCLRPQIKYAVFNSDINALERAVKERLLYVKSSNGEFVTPHRPISQSHFDLCSKPFKDEFIKLAQYVSPLTEKQFLGAYGGRRRAVYESALISLQSQPLVRKDSYINFFVKTEKVNFTAKEDPVCRGISPRNPRYHVSLGPYIKRIEHKVYDIIAAIFGSVTVFKGLNAETRGKQMLAHWDHFDDPVAIGLDASRFDQHVSYEALTWEHSIYHLFYCKDSWFARLLSWQLNNVGFGRVPDGDLKFKLKGGRMSGDMNTALGNCLLMCNMIYSYVKSVGIIKFRLANDGDDCVLFVERRDLHRISTLSNWFVKMGFDMKVETPVDVFEQIEFCQAQPILTPQGCIMVRKYPVSVSKDCLSIKPLLNEKLFNRWIAAIGEGGLALAGGIPVVQEFYQCMIRNSQGAKPLKNDPTQETGLKQLAAGMKREYSKVHYGTRVSFWRAFGIDPARQLALEQVYRHKVLCYDEILGPNDLSDVRL
jgi:hypothetical protein